MGGGALVTAHAANNANEHTITISAMQFTPKTIEVHAGDTIIWKNADLVMHTATAQSNAFNSGNIPANGLWKFVARKKGIIPYSCILHPTMKGALVVQ